MKGDIVNHTSVPVCDDHITRFALHKQETEEKYFTLYDIILYDVVFCEGKDSVDLILFNFLAALHITVYVEFNIY